MHSASKPQSFRCGLDYFVLAVGWPVVGIAALLSRGPLWWNLFIFGVAAGLAITFMILTPYGLIPARDFIMVSYLPFGIYRKRLPNAQVSIEIVRRKPKMGFGQASDRITLVSKEPFWPLISVHRARVSGFLPIPATEVRATAFAACARELGYLIHERSGD